MATKKKCNIPADKQAAVRQAFSLRIQKSSVKGSANPYTSLKRAYVHLSEPFGDFGAAAAGKKREKNF